MTDPELSRYDDLSNEAIGARVKALRLSLDDGLSQAAFARRVSATQKLVQAWESGRSVPGRVQLREMHRLFGVGPGFVLYGDLAYIQADRWTLMR